MNRKEIVLTALNRLLKESMHKDQSKRPKVSICMYEVPELRTNISDAIHYKKRWECAAAWKDFSGAVVYPVPCPTGGEPSMAYCDAEFNGGAFWVGAYGNLRRAYLRHMIQWVQDNLNESE
jgi:hypothetical protein